MNGVSNKTIEKLWNKPYRDAYVESHVKIGIPYQIQALREQAGRKWSQAELGRRTHKPANVICRLEDPEYGRPTIRTLLEVASAFDVALLVKFVSYGRFLTEFEDVSPEALEVPSFTNDLVLQPSQVSSASITPNVKNAMEAEWLGSSQAWAAIEGDVRHGVRYALVGPPPQVNTLAASYVS